MNKEQRDFIENILKHKEYNIDNIKNISKFLSVLALDAPLIPLKGIFNVFNTNGLTNSEIEPIPKSYNLSVICSPVVLSITPPAN